MKLKTLLALGASSALLAASAHAAGPALEAGVGGITNATNDGGGARIVLYDQTDNASGNGAPDQDFEAAYDAYDSTGADDFEVDFADGWDINRVNTTGTTGTAGGSVVDVTFYGDNAGAPDTGNTLCSYDDVAPTSDTAGSFVIDLPADCELDAGIAWMAIQTNQNFGANGQHFWSNRSVATLSEAHWENPGDGFATGCTTFSPVSTCIGGAGTPIGGGFPSFLFSLEGELGEPDAPAVPVIEVPTLDWRGIVALFALLGAAGFLVMRRRA